MRSANGMVLVVGAGPGLGLATARRFAAEGHPVGLVARTPETSGRLRDTLLAEEIRVVSTAADVTQPAALGEAVARLREALGPVQVAVFGPRPDTAWIRPVIRTTPDDLRSALDLSVVAAASLAAHVVPDLRARADGTFLFTTGGAAVEPHPDRAVSAVAYAAESAYVRLLHHALAPESVHVAQVTVVGAMGPGLAHEPSDVAEQLWRAHEDREQPLVVLRADRHRGTDR